MFKVLMICAIFGLAVASPLSPAAPRRAPRYTPPVHHAAHHASHSSDDAHAEVLHSSQDVRADGFESSLETSNHITRSEIGDEHGNMQGNYGWISPEGEHIELSYVADENGYQPKSAWLPTPPPIPVEIQRALAYIAAHPHYEDKYHH